MYSFSQRFEKNCPLAVSAQIKNPVSRRKSCGYLHEDLRPLAGVVRGRARRDHRPRGHPLSEPSCLPAEPTPRYPVACLPKSVLFSSPVNACGAFSQYEKRSFPPQKVCVFIKTMHRERINTIFYAKLLTELKFSSWSFFRG